MIQSPDRVDLRWNQFGTPSSILPDDGSLGAAPGDPVATAGPQGEPLDGRHVRGEGLFRDQVTERGAQVLFVQGIHVRSSL